MSFVDHKDPFDLQCNTLPLLVLCTCRRYLPSIGPSPASQNNHPIAACFILIRAVGGFPFSNP